MTDNKERNSVFGVCANPVKGGATNVFKALTRLLTIDKVIYNENLKDTETQKNGDYVFYSFLSISKSPLTWPGFLLSYLRGVRFIRSEARGYSVALANDFISLLYVFPRKLSKEITVVFHCHVAFKESFFNKVVLSRFINLVADTIIVPSVYLKNELTRIGINPVKINTIYNGIEEPRVEEFSKLKSESDGRLRICIVGVIQYQKGQDILIKAVEDLCKKEIFVSASIVGKTGEEDFYQKLQAHAQLVNTPSEIKFVGELNHSDTLQYISNQDIVVCLSRYRETLPTTLIEAMALQKPVIGNGIGGIPELIENGVNGYLIEENNIEQLEEAIIKLSDPSFRADVGNNGYDIFKEKFSIDRFVDQFSQLIDSVIPNKTKI